VSNHDNLTAKAHAFTDGAVLNPMSDASLVAMISHGGARAQQVRRNAALRKRLTKVEIDALTAFIRAVADLPIALKEFSMRVTNVVLTLVLARRSRAGSSGGPRGDPGPPTAALCSKVLE